MLSTWICSLIRSNSEQAAFALLLWVEPNVPFWVINAALRSQIIWNDDITVMVIAVDLALAVFLFFWR